MAANDIFRSALVKKPKRARFDFSHTNYPGLKIGYGIPTECRFIVPGDEVSVSMAQVARLAPMPVPTFANLKVRHDWFFVPCRLMYNDSDMSAIFGSAGAQSKERASLSIERFYRAFSLSDSEDQGYDDLYATVPAQQPYGDAPVPGSVFDYLGYPVVDDLNVKFGSALRQTLLDYSNHASILRSNNGTYYYSAPDGATSEHNDLIVALSSSSSAKLLLEPLLGYHYIFRDWYRFTGIESGVNTNDPAFNWLENHILSADGFYAGYISCADPIKEYVQDSNYVQGNPKYSMLGKLFQVHLTKDMFTSVRYGNKPTVLIPTGDNANIPTLREASAIQRFIDLISIVGSRYYDKIKALFNVHADGFADDRVQFLARYQQYIKIGEVLTTASTDFADTGDYSGRGILIDGKYLFKRRFTEPGWLYCITSIIPDIAYKGLRRELTDTYYIDTPIPSLAQIGDQSVLSREVHFNVADVDSQEQTINDLSFGDQFRYYAYKSAVSEVHGSFRMSSMASWVPTQDYARVYNVIGFSRVNPLVWNKFFNDTQDQPIFGDRYFFKIDFNEFITRQLPKYINYHL